MPTLQILQIISQMLCLLLYPSDIDEIPPMRPIFILKIKLRFLLILDFQRIIKILLRRLPIKFFFEMLMGHMILLIQRE